MRKPLNWSIQEDELIISNISLIKSKKWKIISQILKEKGFNKKQAECRQRYINFLTLSIDKNSKISNSDLQIFYQKYEQYGPRWTQIQEFLPKKSQVELKNIFYGNIRCLIKKVFKFFTTKTAVFVNKFDTFTLQNIYSGKKNYKGLNIVKDDIKSMRYHFDQKTCLSLIQQKKDGYRKLFNILLGQEQTKKSKHFVCFKKFQEQYFEREQNYIKVLQDSPSELKFTEKSVHHKSIGSQIQVSPHLLQQSSIKQEINQLQLIKDRWNQNQCMYKNLNAFENHHQIQRANVYFNTGQPMYFQTYPNPLTMFNTFQNSENPYFYCHPWN